MAIFLYPAPRPCQLHGGQDQGASPRRTSCESDPGCADDTSLPTRRGPSDRVFQADDLYLYLRSLCDPDLAAAVLADQTAEEAALFGYSLMQAADGLRERLRRLGRNVVFRVSEGCVSPQRVIRMKPFTLVQASEELERAGNWYLSVAFAGFGVSADKRDAERG